jgi:hypothetical protein
LDWGQESAFYLLPHAMPARLGTAVPAPALRIMLSHDHLAAISRITLDGRLFLQCANRASPLRGLRLPVRAASRPHPPGKPGFRIPLSAAMRVFQAEPS